ncbi:MAG: hypothetical protein LC799_32730, partial [Actinobacteria bacterium]|nr:hypothetical protein [Actinomycetota bacterium]
MINTIYNPDLKAHLSLDENDRVRHVRHSQGYRLSDNNIPRLAANEYLLDMAATLRIPPEQLRALDKKAQHLVPVEQGVEYQFEEEKRLFDSITISYYQTYLNVPVWRRGLSVKVKQGPNRIVSVTNNSEEDLEGRVPDEKVIERYREMFRVADARRQARSASRDTDETDETTSFVREALGVSPRGAAGRKDGARLLSGKFFVYKHVPDRRFAGKPSDEIRQESVSLEDGPPPFIEIPPISDDIQPGRAYVVAELIFRYDLPGYGELVWLALVELETGSILYLECMTCGVNGLVFKRDPMVSSGDLTVTSDDGNAILDDHDFDEVLNALDPPSGGTQNLSGTYVVVQH